MSFHVTRVYRGDRPSLPREISEWPPPNHTKKWTLCLPGYVTENTVRRRRYSFGFHILCSGRGRNQEQVVDCVAALETAMTRNDIDTLELSAKCTPSKKLKSLVTKLLQQDQRVWKVNYYVAEGPVALDQEWLSSLQPVRFLALDRDNMNRNVDVDELVPMLSSLRNLEELDLSMLCLFPPDLFMLYQHQFLAEKICHVFMSYSGPCSYPVRFPVSASSFLIGLNICLDGNLVSEWIREASTLHSLRVLGIELDVPPNSNMECFHSLSTWIGSSSCKLSHVAIWFPDGGASSLSMEGFQSLVPAIGRNRSITHLSIFEPREHDVSMILHLLPQIVTEMNSIKHFEVKSIGIYNWSSEPDFLCKWLIQMRSTRFVVLELGSIIREILKYLHRVHTRWNHWEQLCRRKRPSSAASFFISGYKKYWANELERIDCSNQPRLRAVSLDAMFFLLRPWLSNIARVPVRARLKHCNQKVLEEGVPRTVRVRRPQQSLFPPIGEKIYEDPRVSSSRVVAISNGAAGVGEPIKHIG